MAAFGLFISEEFPNSPTPPTNWLVLMRNSFLAGCFASANAPFLFTLGLLAPEHWSRSHPKSL